MLMFGQQPLEKEVRVRAVYLHRERRRGKWGGGGREGGGGLINLMINVLQLPSTYLSVYLSKYLVHAPPLLQTDLEDGDLEILMGRRCTFFQVKNPPSCNTTVCHLAIIVG
jgi:hypothetical protein